MASGDSDQFNASFDKVGQILTRKSLSVPNYQRSYAWGKDEILELFLDLTDAISNNKPSYFLGTVVGKRNGESSYEIVDGQQRLATISILLAAIRDYCSEHNDPEGIEMANQFLFKKNFITRKRTSNLMLNQVDNFLFETQILAPKDERNKINKKDLQASQNRLLEAYFLAKDQVFHICQLSSDPLKVIGEWLSYINERLSVIFVEVADEDGAFTVFETLNDRGLVLAESDLLKNYLLSLAGNRGNEILSRWEAMVSIIENSTNKSLIVTFVRHFWASRNGLTRKKELYKKIRSSIKDQQSALELASELEADAKIYAALFNSDSDFWNSYNYSLKEDVKTLKKLGLEQNRPLLLAIIRKFNYKEISSALHLLISAAVRTNISGVLGSSSLENGYAETAKKVNEGIIKNVSDLVNEMKFVPNDNMFIDSFKNARVNKGWLARYYLCELELSKCNDEVSPNLDPDKLNLEHIMPNELGNNWPNINNDEHKDYIKRLGNMTLMSTRVNSNIGNENFHEKIERYKSSEINLTRELEAFSNWGPQEISQRQVELANLAKKVWPFRP